MNCIWTARSRAAGCCATCCAAGFRHQPPPRCDADEAHEHRGDLSPSQHIKARAGPQDLSLPSARIEGRSPEPCLGDGHHPRLRGGRLYIPLRQGFLYLVAIIDWATRRVLSWRLSNTLTAGFCVEALSEALARFGKPEIFNTDQSLPSRKRGARNSPATSLPRCCGITGSRSAWTAAGAATTTSSSSACGGP